MKNNGLRACTNPFFLPKIYLFLSHYSV